MNAADRSQPISLNTAAILTGFSLRTWQRRIEEGQVPRLGDGRALVPFDSVRPALAVTLTAEDVQALVRADQGDAPAQADIGALFALNALRHARVGPAHRVMRGGGSLAAARHFLEQAAQQDEADAMHWLGTLCAAGLWDEPGADGDALALMWTAKAAAQGHAVARGQLAALMPPADAPGLAPLA